MPARDEQHQEGEGDRLEQADGQGVGLHVVDRDEGRAVAPYETLAELQAHAQAQGQARLHRGGHGRQLAWVHAAPLQRLLDYMRDVLLVELLGHSGDDATRPTLEEFNSDKQFSQLFRECCSVTFVWWSVGHGGWEKLLSFTLTVTTEDVLHLLTQLSWSSA